MTQSLPDDLLRYLERRREEHQDEIDRAIGRLTPREQRLVREAAVMGYVRGTYHVRGADIPPDSVIMAEVIAACVDMADLYPFISGGA